MPGIHQRSRCAILLAALALLLWANDSRAQCMSGGRSRLQTGLTLPTFPQQQFMVPRQQLMQQLLGQQLMQQMLLQQQLTSMAGPGQQPQLRQPLQPPAGDYMNSAQPEALALSLTALRRQQSENSRLIALERQHRNVYQSLQSGRLTRYASVLDKHKLVDTVQTALDRTQALLALLGQENAIANQTAWIKALEHQFASLMQISKRYSSGSAP